LAIAAEPPGAAPAPASRRATTSAAARATAASRHRGDARGEAPEAPAEHPPRRSPSGRRAGPPQGGAPQAAEALEHLQRIFARAPTPPRWPMYVRQVKQFLRGIDDTFDERAYGFATIVEFLRACQRENLLRLERDRQGVLRVFAGPQLPRAASAEPAEEQADTARTARRAAASRDRHPRGLGRGRTRGTAEAAEAESTTGPRRRDRGGATAAR
jgi:hypothetical protein